MSATFSLSFLNCSCNSSGNSSLISIGKSSEESDIVAKYMLNCGDSTQRFCADNKIKLRKLRFIGVTSLAPHNISGLPGIILCLSDLGVGELHIVGPCGLRGVIENSFPFVNRRYPELHIKEVGGDLESTDPVSIDLGPVTAEVTAVGTDSEPSRVVAVSYVIRPKPGLTEITNQQSDNRNVFSSVACLPVTTFATVPHIDDLVRSARAKGADVATFVWVQAAMSSETCPAVKDYAEQLCVQENISGVFLDCVDKSDVCEFRRGQMSICTLGRLFPLFGSCLKGLKTAIQEEQNNSTPEPIGNEETHEQYMLQRGKMISAYPRLVVDLRKASVEYDNGALSDIATAVSCTGDAAKDLRELARVCKEYQDTIDKSVGALFAPSDANVISSIKPAIPLPIKPSETKEDNRLMATLLRAKLGKRPRAEAEVAVETELNVLEDKSQPDTSVTQDANCASEKPSLARVTPPCPVDPSVVFLGTGCAAPSRHRSNSCIVLRLPSQYVNFPSSEQLVMLDCGEGAASQLYFSVSGDESRMSDSLKNLRIVWISHHHADHHCGLTMLLETRARYRNLARSSSRTNNNGRDVDGWGRVVVVAPPSVLRYHEYCACVAGVDDEAQFVPIENFKLWSSAEVMQASGLTVQRLISVPVYHCNESFGAVLCLADRDLKVVFSGDCRPSKALVTAGLDCDLLIHEATFDDTLCSDAFAKRHCTTSEAANVGLQMRAKAIVLTHFSQRYPKVVQCSTESCGSSVEYAVAFDFLRFHFPSQVAVLPKAISQILATLSHSLDDDAGTDV